MSVKQTEVKRFPWGKGFCHVHWEKANVVIKPKQNINDIFFIEFLVYRINDCG
jgi:hypothetical protein